MEITEILYLVIGSLLAFIFWLIQLEQKRITKELKEIRSGDTKTGNGKTLIMEMELIKKDVKANADGIKRNTDKILNIQKKIDDNIGIMVKSNDSVMSVYKLTAEDIHIMIEKMNKVLNIKEKS